MIWQLLAGVMLVTHEWNDFITRPVLLGNNGAGVIDGVLAQFLIDKKTSIPINKRSGRCKSA